MDDLIAFLRARLDDDERIARACGPVPWVDWVTGTVQVDPEAIRDDHLAYGHLGYVVGAHPGELGDAYRAHIARHDPDRVLADVAAKRQIIELHKIEVKKSAPISPFDPMTGERLPEEYDVECDVCGWVSDDQTSACTTLRLLTLPYADHPDYREEFRP